MKTTWRAVAAVLILGLGGAAQAQTCTPQAGSLNDASATFSVNTCQSTNQLLSLCNGLDAIGASPDTIYSMQFTTPPVGGIVATPTGYDLKMALLQGTCSAGSTCLREADSGGAGAAENLLVTGVPIGNYFLVLTSFGGSPDCGPTQVVVNLIIPVTLQRFSIE